jgi:hypothetical protein
MPSGERRITVIHERDADGGPSCSRAPNQTLPARYLDVAVVRNRQDTSSRSYQDPRKTAGQPGDPERELTRHSAYWQGADAEQSHCLVSVHGHMQS